MSEVVFWGENGQYGPFDTQEDGWPDAGQVMRYFREKQGITAKALTGLEEYAEAVDKAKQALIACHHINSLQNVMMITDIHRRVARSSYGTSRDVEDLGNMLKEWYG